MNIATNEPSGRWAHLTDDDLRGCIDDYRRLGFDQPHTPDRIVELEDELDRRGRTVAA
jgi:hypothetical protein